MPKNCTTGRVDGMERKKDLKHGKVWTYDHHKCRCAYCKMAKHLYDKKYYNTHIEYAQRIRDQSREQYRQRKALGLCLHCGWPIEEERKHTTRCWLCYERGTREEKERRSLHYERGFR